MNSTDRAACGAALIAAAELYNQPLSDMGLEVYLEALDDLDWVTQIEPALQRCLQECQFFPKPVDIRQRAGVDVEHMAEMAFTHLQQLVRTVGIYGTPRFDDPVLALTIQTLFGTWRQCCDQLPGEGPTVNSWAKRFTRHYLANRVATIRRGLRAGPYPVPNAS